MYLEHIEIENTGPISHLDYGFNFYSEIFPKVTVFVGANGAGKSIVLSHIVNSIISAKSIGDDSTDVETGKVYKYRSNMYILSGREYSFSKITFSEGIFLSEIQLHVTRQEFEEKFGICLADSSWKHLKKEENSLFFSNFHKKHSIIERFKDTGSYLFFPANRFEDPAWLNKDNLANTANYMFTKRIRGLSKRNVIQHSPLRENQDWLLDLLYDSYVLEGRGRENHENSEDKRAIATRLLSDVENFLKLLFQVEGPISWSIGRRGSRTIVILCNGRVLSSNLFSLSTGQALLLNILLTIVRDYDLSFAKLEGIDDVRGIVLIDEIDLHLNVEFQYSVLPILISLFPRVQFVITSHSPLFLLGLHNTVGPEKYDIVELPSGSRIDVHRFSEFEIAYKHFRNSSAFTDDLSAAIRKNQSHVVFVEGDIDYIYIMKASELLDRSDLLDRVRIIDSNGHGGLKQIWGHFNTTVSEALSHRVLLLYDCDTNQENAKKKNVFKRTIPRQISKIEKGIENLFPDGTIEKAWKYKHAFFDITQAHLTTIRGIETVIPESWSVNRDEKRNLCDWLVQNGDQSDFCNFRVIFDILENFLVDEV